MKRKGDPGHALQPYEKVLQPRIRSFSKCNEHLQKYLKMWFSGEIMPLQQILSKLQRQRCSGLLCTLTFASSKKHLQTIHYEKDTILA
jgi:hypothetical protein